MRKFAAGILTAGVAVGLMGFAPASAQTTDNMAFCDAVLNAEKVFAPDEVDPAAAEAALAEVVSTAPPEVAADVQTIATIGRSALESGSDPSEDEAYNTSLAAVGEYTYTNCGWQTAEVTMAEYEFTGLPKSFTTGPVALKITNDGAEFHELMTLRIKSKKDTLKKVIGLSETKARKKVQIVGHAFAAPGETAYAFLDFKRPGKYGAVCFIPVGTTPEAVAAAEEGGEGGEHGGGDESGPPHAIEGMYQAFKVTSA